MVNTIAALILAARHFGDKALELKKLPDMSGAATTAHNRALDCYQEARDLIHDEGSEFIRKFNDED